MLTQLILVPEQGDPITKEITGPEVPGCSLILYQGKFYGYRRMQFADVGVKLWFHETGAPLELKD